MDILTVIVVGIVLFFGWWYVLLKPRSGLPPGLPRLPILGSLPFLDADDPLKCFLQLKKKFGDVFTVYMANRPVVYLNSYDSIKEALEKKGENFMHRPYLFMLTESLGDEGKTSYASSSGREHKTIRHFTNKVLIRKFGFGTKTYEDHIIKEIEAMFEEIDKNEGMSYDTSDLISMAIANMINVVLYGHRLEYNDEIFGNLLHALQQFCIDMETGQILNIFPWLRYMPWQRSIVDKMAKRKVNQKHIMEQMIQRHEEGHEDVQNSFMTAWLDRMEKEKRSSNPEPVSTIQASIDEYIGKTLLPTMEDRKKLVLAEATILEVLRCHPPVTLALPHTNLLDDTIGGYHIPAGTMVIPNLHAPHHDERYWNDPHEFNPERFIDGDGQIDKLKFDNVIAFSMGKRVCPGEALARMELFLTFTSLLQRYTFTLPPGEKLPSLKMKLGLTLTIPPYKICAVRRYKN